MKSKVIVLASLLKPVDDARMYKKFALSLAETPSYEIHLVGRTAPLPQAPPNVHFHPLFSFDRLSHRRLGASWKLLTFLRQVKPDLIVANTAEFQPVTTLYKILFGSKLCYDVQENYFRNVARSGVYPKGVGDVLGHSVRAVEHLSRPWTDHYFLAERAYAEELPFVGGKHTILENKYKPDQTAPARSLPPPSTGERFAWVYTGTIAEHYGVFDAIGLVERLHALDTRFHLTIVGYCTQRAVLARLRARVAASPCVTLVGGNKPVPHAQILAAIGRAGVGVVPYRPNPSTENCVPTKLFEYAAHRLPMLIPPNPRWQAFCAAHDAALTVDFSNPNTKILLNQIFSKKFYQGDLAILANVVLWDAHEADLLRDVVAHTLAS